MSTLLVTGASGHLGRRVVEILLAEKAGTVIAGTRDTAKVADLVAKGAVRKNEKVKVLGTGEIAVKLNVAVDKVSGSAEQKIVAAGGSVK